MAQGRHFAVREKPFCPPQQLMPAMPGVGSTRMFCEARQQVENDYLNALQQATRYEIEGNTLRLYADPGDKPLAAFEAVYL